MDEDMSAGLRCGFLDGLEDLGHDLGHAATRLGGDPFVDVDGTHVNRTPVGGGLGDFLGLNQNESASLLDKSPVLVDGFQADLKLSVGGVGAGFHPMRAEALDVCREGVAGREGGAAPGLALRALGNVAHGHPTLAMAENIVIRKRQKLVALRSIPIGHRLREVVAVRPKGVRMEIPLPPAKFRGEAYVGTEDKQQENPTERNVLFQIGATMAGGMC